MKSSALFPVIVLCLVLLFVIGSYSPTPLAFATKSTIIHTPSVAAETASQTKSAAQILFDDFSYSKHQELTKHGWIVRSAPGWPGVPGATWWSEGVTFLK